MKSTKLSLKYCLSLLVSLLLMLSGCGGESTPYQPLESSYPQSGSSGNNNPSTGNSSQTNNSGNGSSSIQDFSIQDSNRTQPNDVINEVVYLGRGGGGLQFCLKGGYSYPELDEQGSSTKSDWLDTMYIVTCGWKNGEQIDVSIESPNGNMSSKIISAQTDFYSSIPYAYIDYQPPFDSVPGQYTFSFRGESGSVKHTVYETVPGDPRMYFLNDIRSYYIYGVNPQERVRFFLYASGNNAYQFTAWQYFNADNQGHLIISVDPSAGEYYAIGDSSGPITYNILRAQAVSVSCSNALSPRLKIGGYASVSDDPPLDNRVRRGPGTGSEIVGYITAGHSMRVLDGPECADGYVWWKVQANRNSSVVGWSAEGDDSSYWLIPCDRSSCP